MNKWCLIFLCFLLVSCGKGNIREEGYKLAYDEINHMSISPNGDNLWVTYSYEKSHYIYLNDEIKGPFPDVYQEAYWNDAGTGLIYAYQNESGWYVSAGVRTYGPFDDVKHLGYVQGQNGYYFFGIDEELTTFYYNNQEFGPYELDEVISLLGSEKPVIFTYPDAFNFCFGYRSGESHYAVFGNRSTKYLGQIHFSLGNQWEDSLENYRLYFGFVYKDKDENYLWINGNEIGPLDIVRDPFYSELFIPDSDFYYYNPEELIIYHYKYRDEDFIYFNETKYGPYLSAEMIEYSNTQLVFGYKEKSVDVFYNDLYLKEYPNIAYEAEWDVPAFTYQMSNTNYLWVDNEEMVYDGSIALVTKDWGRRDIAYSYIKDEQYYVVLDSETNGPYQVHYSVTTNFPVGVYTNISTTNYIEIIYNTNQLTLTNFLLVSDVMTNVIETNYYLFSLYSNRISLDKTNLNSGTADQTHMNSPYDEQINLFQTLKEFVSSMVKDIRPQLNAPSREERITNRMFSTLMSDINSEITNINLTELLTNVFGELAFDEVALKQKFPGTNFSIPDEKGISFKPTNFLITNLVKSIDYLTNNMDFDWILTNLNETNLLEKEELVISTIVTDIISYDKEDMIIITNLAMELNLDIKLDMFSFWSNDMKYLKINNDQFGPYDQSVWIEYNTESREFAFAYRVSNQVYVNIDGSVYGPYEKTPWLNSDREIPFTVGHRIFSDKGRYFLFVFIDEEGWGVNVNGTAVQGFSKVIAVDSSGKPFISEKSGDPGYIFKTSFGEFYIQIHEMSEGPYESVNVVVNGLYYQNDNYIYRFTREGEDYINVNGEEILYDSVLYRFVHYENKDENKITAVGLLFQTNENCYFYDGEVFSDQLISCEPEKWFYTDNYDFVMLFQETNQYIIWGDQRLLGEYEFADISLSDQGEIYISGADNEKIFLYELKKFEE